MLIKKSAFRVRDIHGLIYVKKKKRALCVCMYVHPVCKMTERIYVTLSLMII